MSRELAQQEAELLRREPRYVQVASDRELIGVRFCDESAPRAATSR
jgi:hypothetical protein